MTTSLGSILLGTADPGPLRAWYECAFDVKPNADGFLELGGVAVLVDQRADVATTTAEPGRVVLNFHVDDARATAAHLDEMGVTWHAPLEYREDAGAWFGTVLDPDGNYVQVIELTEAYYAERGGRR
ncbi:MAG TPA: VOC family protein [Frankiaceae bacterium]|nr:VOC family protein [Frankiaceae bacterium]